MTKPISHVLTTRRCPKCMKDTSVFFATNEVPRQNARFEFDCSHCGVRVVDYVEAVAVLETVPDDAVQGQLTND